MDLSFRDGKQYVLVRLKMIGMQNQELKSCVKGGTKVFFLFLGY